jgi:hypothetical protein
MKTGGVLSYQMEKQRHGMGKPGMPFTLPSYDADTTPIAGPMPGFSRIAPREESNGKLVRVKSQARQQTKPSVPEFMSTNR